MSERSFVFIVSFMWGSSSHKNNNTAISKGATQGGGGARGLWGADHG